MIQGIFIVKIVLQFFGVSFYIIFLWIVNSVFHVCISHPCSHLVEVGEKWLKNIPLGLEERLQWRVITQVPYFFI